MPSNTDAAIRNASPDEVRAPLNAAKPGTITLLDVRMEPEYAEFHLPGATLVPLPELPDRLGEIDRDKPVAVYCRSGMRSAAAAKILAGAGFANIVNLLGGATAWRGAVAAGTPDAGMTLLSRGRNPAPDLACGPGHGSGPGRLLSAPGGFGPDAETATACSRLAASRNDTCATCKGFTQSKPASPPTWTPFWPEPGTQLEGGLPAQAFLEMLGGEPTPAREALEYGRVRGGPGPGPLCPAVAANRRQDGQKPV